MDLQPVTGRHAPALGIGEDAVAQALVGGKNKWVKAPGLNLLGRYRARHGHAQRERRHFGRATGVVGAMKKAALAALHRGPDVPGDLQQGVFILSADRAAQGLKALLDAALVAKRRLAIDQQLDIGGVDVPGFEAGYRDREAAVEGRADGNELPVDANFAQQWALAGAVSGERRAVVDHEIVHVIVAARGPQVLESQRDVVAGGRVMLGAGRRRFDAHGVVLHFAVHSQARCRQLLSARQARPQPGVPQSRAVRHSDGVKRGAGAHGGAVEHALALAEAAVAVVIQPDIQVAGRGYARLTDRRLAGREGRGELDTVLIVAAVLPIVRLGGRGKSPILGIDL